MKDLVDLIKAAGIDPSGSTDKKSALVALAGRAQQKLAAGSVDTTSILPVVRGTSAAGGASPREDPRYERYFKMLAMGAPRAAVEAKMKLDGHRDFSLLDTDGGKVNAAGNAAAKVRFQHVCKDTQSLDGGSTVKFNGSYYGLAIGSAVGDGDVFKVRIVATRDWLLLGVIGTTDVSRQDAYDRPATFGWRGWRGGFYTVAAGKSSKLPGWYGTPPGIGWSPAKAGEEGIDLPGWFWNPGDVVLFKLSSGALRMRCRGKTLSVPLGSATQYHICANFSKAGDSVELMDVSPAEAASL